MKLIYHDDPAYADCLALLDEILLPEPQFPEWVFRRRDWCILPVESSDPLLTINTIDGITEGLSSVIYIMDERPVPIGAEPWWGLRLERGKRSEPISGTHEFPVIQLSADDGESTIDPLYKMSFDRSGEDQHMNLYTYPECILAVSGSKKYIYFDHYSVNFDMILFEKENIQRVMEIFWEDIMDLDRPLEELTDYNDPPPDALWKDSIHKFRDNYRFKMV